MNQEIPTQNCTITELPVVFRPEPEPVPKPRKPGTFTTETAKIARRIPRRKPTDAKSGPEPELKPSQPSPSDPYVVERIACTREQIAMLDERLKQPNLKPAEIKAITEAIARLTEVERKLSMRPDPGQLRQDGRHKPQNVIPSVS